MKNNSASLKPLTLTTVISTQCHVVLAPNGCKQVSSHLTKQDYLSVGTQGSKTLVNFFNYPTKEKIKQII